MGTGRSRPRSRSRLHDNTTTNISNTGIYSQGRGDLNRSDSGGLDDHEPLEYKEKGSMESERKTDREKRQSMDSEETLQERTCVESHGLESGGQDGGQGDKAMGSGNQEVQQGSLDRVLPLEDASKTHDPVENAASLGGEAGESSLMDASDVDKEQSNGRTDLETGGLSKEETVSEEKDIDEQMGLEAKGSVKESIMSEEKESDETISLEATGSTKEALVSEEKEEEEDVEEKTDPDVKEKDNDAALNQTQGIGHGAAAKVSHGAHTEQPSQTEPVATKWPWPTNATTVNEVVEEVWGEIDDQCQLFPLSYTGLTQSLTGWKVVRLFVSSTFHDFQCEREILVKRVFPELKEWCEKRHIHFIECDLRWGVPRDSTTRTVLCTCMEEIDRCHEDTEGEPFFLNMLGDRYGWVPTKDDVPEDIARKYDWVGNSSITHMEILHGAFRFCNRNAAFFLREIEDMPVDVRKKFADPTDLGLKQIDRLKTKLASRFPEQAYHYTCQYDPTGTSGIKLMGFEKFSQDVLEYFKMAIDRKYPKPAAELTKEEKENETQALYLGHKGQLIYGREREIKYLQDYVTGVGDYSTASLGDQWQARFHPEKFQQEHEADDGELKEGEMDERGSDEKNDHNESETKEGDAEASTEKKSHPPVAVVAQSGQGKSSLMARFIVEAKQAGLNVFFHLVGCSGESLSLNSMLARLCQFLASSDDERISKLTDMCSPDTVKLTRTLLKEYTDTGKQLLIAIDDLTQLQVNDIAWCDWIPQALEGGVYMVFSMVSEEYKMSEIKAKVPTIQYLELSHLDQCARVTIVENYFAQYNKKLDAQQLKLLTESEGAKNALWLALACEELRVFGAFEALTELIRTLPNTLTGLVCDILHRLTMEDETGLVEKTLCYLECCMKGLTEKELECLLGDRETKTPIPKLHLAMVRRTLKPFLRKISGMCKVECITFFHHAIGMVVRDKWLSDPTTLRRYHLSMADFYQYCLDDQDKSFVAKNIAFHLSKSNEKGRLVDYLLKDKSSRSLGPGLWSNYLRSCRCRTMINTNGPFHSQLFICNFCGPQRKGFGNDVWRNEESCMLCGNLVSPIFKREENKAYRCQRHPQKGPRFPNMKTCMLCCRTIMKGQEKPVYLCQYCHLGGFPTCTGLETG